MEPIKADAKRRENGTFGKGNTANPSGRPKGSTLKEFQAQKYRDMDDAEKEKELKRMGDELRWRMSEGNPATNTDLKLGGELKIVVSKETAERYGLSVTQDTEDSSEGQA